MIDKYRYGKTWAIPYETKSGTKRVRPVKIADCKVGEASDVIVKRTKYSFKTTLRQKLNAHKCELCGKHTEDMLEVHVVRNLNQLGNSWWEMKMKDMRRKTLVICPACHRKIHG